MSNVATAIERAQTVSSARAAARLYNDLEYELALGAEGSEELYEAGEEALRVLEQRFPDVTRRARQVTDPPRLSRSAGTVLAGAALAGAPAARRRPRRRWRRWAAVGFLYELHRRRPRSGWQRWVALALLTSVVLVLVAAVVLRLAIRLLGAAAAGIGTMLGGSAGGGRRRSGAGGGPVRVVFPVAPRAPRWPARGRR